MNWQEAWLVLCRYMDNSRGITYAMQGYALDNTGAIRPDVLADHVFISSFIPIARQEIARKNGT